MHLKVLGILFLVVCGLCLLSSDFSAVTLADNKPKPANSYQGKSKNIADSNEFIVEKYSSDAPMAQNFSLEAALDAVDRASLLWCDKSSCVTCHTNGYYLTLPLLTKVKGRRPAGQKVYDHAIRYVESWRKESPSGSHSIVATACFLAIADAQRGQGLDANIFSLLVIRFQAN